ncbi:MAG: HAMP domain-containing protein [Bacteroidetes bacterium]|nr:HAMP domain-containing protein [Bacteroidota bacterium]
MTTRVRLSLLFAGFSLVLLVGTLGGVYASHARSRQAEFFDRLRTQCYRTASMLGEVKETDRSLLRILDRNSIHRMYDEKVLLFDHNDNLLYSSLADETIHYSKQLLDKVRSGEEMTWRDADGDEVVGVHYTANGADYVVLASAYDTYGRRELHNLLGTLSAVLVLGTLFIFGAGYLFIGLAFRPLEDLSRAIDHIGIHRLDQQVPVRGTKGEIDRLATAYNAMLSRLRKSFELQKAFVNNASHELRTPLARMNAQVEQALRMPPGDAAVQRSLLTLQADITEQGQLIDSLLLLQQLQAHLPVAMEPVRVDEVLFAAIAEVNAAHPGLHATVDMDEGIRSEAQLTTDANRILLRTALRNLLANAARYSPDGTLAILIGSPPNMVQLRFCNPGAHALPADRVFQPFFRGPESTHMPGSGLGLSIVQQVAEQFGGSLQYSFNGSHCFTLSLPRTA